MLVLPICMKVTQPWRPQHWWDTRLWLMVSQDFIVLPFVQTLWFYPHFCSAVAVPGAGSAATFSHPFMVQISAHKSAIIYHLFYLLSSFIIYYLFYELSFVIYQNLCYFWAASQGNKGISSSLLFCTSFLFSHNLRKILTQSHLDQPRGVQKRQKSSSKKCIEMSYLDYLFSILRSRVIFAPV